MEKKVISMFKHPIPGYAYVDFTSPKRKEISFRSSKSYNFEKFEYRNKVKYVVFTNKNKNKVIQEFKKIRSYYCQPGEKNINSKLSNKDSFKLLIEANMKGASNKELAKKYNVSADYISSIKNLKARVGTHLNILNNKDKIKVKSGQVEVAKRLMSKKLSPSIANFIRNDKKKYSLSTRDLASKYHVSMRTIQRILKNQMYKQ